MIARAKAHVGEENEVNKVMDKDEKGELRKYKKKEMGRNRKWSFLEILREKRERRDTQCKH